MLISDGGGLPESAVRRLCSLLDGEGGPWRTVAELLELDVTTVQQQASPTVYILRCVKVSGGVTAGAPPGTGLGRDGRGAARHGAGEGRQRRRQARGLKIVLV